MSSTQNEADHTARAGQHADLVTVMRHLGLDLEPSRRGQYAACCPFHNDSNPSLFVTPSLGLWQCFGCGKGGDVVSFVQFHFRLDGRNAARAKLREHALESL